MAIGNKLFALAEREFKHSRASPTQQRFRGLKFNIGKYDESYDRKRGAAVRMMGVVLRDDDKALYDRVAVSPQTAHTYSDAASWFRREAEYLRRTAHMLETAADRLSSVIERYQNREQPQQSVS